MGLLGIVVERFLFRRFYRADPILSLLVTFGLAMVVEQLLRILWGAAPIPFAIPSYLSGLAASIGGFIYPYYRLAFSASPCLPSSACGSSSTRPPSAGSCAPACRTRTWWARSVSRWLP